MKKLNLFFSCASVIFIFGLNTEIDLLSADQNILQQKCTKCHGIKVPENYTKGEWKYNVERMAKRAGLNSQEIQIIIDMNKSK